MSTDFRLIVLPEFANLGGNDRQGMFVVQVQPPAARSERPPVDMVLALDTSGSMEGLKLGAALKSAAAIARVLGPDDTFACVTFADQVRELVPRTQMTPTLRERVIQQLGVAKADGSTDLAEGMLRAASVAEAGRGGLGGRVLLLTDGCPTAGVTDERQILTLARKACRAATLSTFGFGRDVNPHLLHALAEAGRGNYSFIEEREPPMAAIAAEVGGLILTVAAGVSLRLQPSPGVRVQQVLRPNTPPLLGDGSLALDLPSLVAEEPVSLVFELAWSGSVPRPLATATLAARRTDNGEAFTVSAEVAPAVAAQRGAAVPAAIKEIVLSRASVGLHKASLLRGAAAKAAAPELLQLRAELAAIARLTGVDADPQVQAALQMLGEGQRALEQAGDGRHDMVASATALAGRRSTNVGHLIHADSDGSAQAPFTNPSQRFGLEALQRALGMAPPDRKAHSAGVIVPPAQKPGPHKPKK